DAREWIKEQYTEQGQKTIFLVADDHGGLLGSVRREDIFSKLYPDEEVITKLIKTQAPFVYPDSQLGLAVDMLDRHETDLLPVIDHQTKKLLGEITHKEIFK